VSLRLLYLIFRQVLGLALLARRPVLHQGPCQGSSCCATRSPSCAAPTHDTPGLGGPGRVRRARAAVAPQPRGHPGQDPALSSPPRAPTMDLPETDRTAPDRRCARRPWWSGWRGEPALGVPADSGRVVHTWPRRVGRRALQPKPG